MVNKEIYQQWAAHTDIWVCTGCQSLYIRDVRLFLISSWVFFCSSCASWRKFRHSCFISDKSPLHRASFHDCKYFHRWSDTQFLSLDRLTVRSMSCTVMHVLRPLLRGLGWYMLCRWMSSSLTVRDMWCTRWYQVFTKINLVMDLRPVSFPSFGRSSSEGVL